ncbi:hypothetical protein BCR33DRAFT_770708 [Rhizoclosmatium globosum]|uniref:G domain-containing protein n=1 Tax=Rhizoclosmatium globosum TaxID=329046 RepID=A0A1Y2BKH3_9FUNG|nr:hypothetical protein BCR33DRAFT_770708 [Rhizoclosmatium globosum]|eukprot:ORY35262.1 hypothetical protein BCR33DRAFT_770708 [Rhizoclosmatium globosum]
MGINNNTPPAKGFNPFRTNNTLSTPSSSFHYKIAILGNPGAGKSTLLNHLAGKNPNGTLPFDAGLSYATGKRVCKPVTRGYCRFLDFPGFADVQRQTETGLEIANIINNELVSGDASFKFVFVVTLQQGRVRPEDIATMVTILTAIKAEIGDDEIKCRYGVIVNQVKKRQYKELEDRNGDAFRMVYASLQMGGFGTQNVLFLPEVEDLSEADNAIVPLESLPGLKVFVDNLPCVELKQGTRVTIDTDQGKLQELHEKLLKSDGVIAELIEELRHLKVKVAEKTQMARESNEAEVDWMAAISPLMGLLLSGAKVGLRYMTGPQQSNLLRMALNFI